MVFTTVLPNGLEGIGDTQDIYLLMGLEFLFTFYVLPSVVALIQSSATTNVCLLSSHFVVVLTSKLDI